MPTNLWWRPIKKPQGKIVLDSDLQDVLELRRVRRQQRDVQQPLRDRLLRRVPVGVDASRALKRRRHGQERVYYKISRGGLGRWWWLS